jgi:hypothetical protein
MTAATDVGDTGGEAAADSAAANGAASKTGILQRVKGAVIRTEKEFAFVKGLAVVSLAGTLIGGYFQYLSSYQDKVSAQAKDDMAAATAAFVDTSTALSTAITLQGMLFYDFIRANKLNASSDGNALTNKEAQQLYKSYNDAAAALGENINLIARKTEIYIDWASNVDRDPAAQTAFGTDPISTSMLGAVDFDCDSDMPNFDADKHVITKKKGKTHLDVDWYSAKHHVLTIAYCFHVTHQVSMELIRQWASQSTFDPNAIAAFFDKGAADRLQDRLDSEVVRLNDFMSRAMNEIEHIRIKYRPNGLQCSLPGVREAVGLFSNRCTPLRFSIGAM